jgi:hypothetical protein
MIPDLFAPIIPSQGAAGLLIGDKLDISVLTMDEKGKKAEFLSPEAKISSDAVDIWLSHGIITQICVHGNYQGTLLNIIKLGMTLNDLKNNLGAYDEDEEDNLIIKGIEGIIIEVETRMPGMNMDDLHIIAMCVYKS